MTYINITSFCKLILIGFFQGVNQKDLSRDHCFRCHDNKSVARGLPIRGSRKTMDPWTKVVKMILIKLKQAKFK